MKYLLLGLKSLTVFLLIPMVLGLYIDRYRTVEGIRRQKALTKNPFAILLLLVVVGGISLEVWFFPRELDREEHPLVFLDAENYQRELDACQPKQQSPNWPADRPQLVRKLKHALYAWRKADYQEAINTLHQLRNANDSYGHLARIESHTVLNNLGVSYFKLQRNREFKASWFLQQAQLLAEEQSADSQEIVNNMKALDRMVNNLD